MNANISEMDRINFEFEEKEVTIIAKESTELILIDGIHFALKKNQKIKVPYWIAKELISMGKVELDSKTFISFPILDRIHNEEQSTPALVEIDPFLFRKVREETKRLEEERTSMSIKIKQQMEGVFNQLLLLRLKKILKIAERVNPGSSTSEKYMTPEEKWLFNQIGSIVKEWKEKIGLESPVEEYAEFEFIT